jgi:nucleoside-diphosphate-sugar epimerase
MMKIFLTGATGYIGGTVAAALLAAGHKVVGLAHPDQQSLEAAIRTKGFEPVFGLLDDTAFLTKMAGEADAVINAANVDHRGSTEAFLTALKGTNKIYIQTSGSGVTADMAGGEPSAAIYEDDNVVVPLPSRAARIAINNIVLAAASTGVCTAVIAPPMIYGKGTGMNPNSIQVPAIIKVAKKFGVAKYVGRGENRWSNVHVEDLAQLFLAVLEHGKAGAFYYAENGENSLKEVAEAVSRLLGFGNRAESLTVPEAYIEYGEMMTNLSFGSNSRVRATRAHKELGWFGKQRPLIDDIEHGSYLEARS